MGIHLADQTLSFFCACLLGAALGAFYDVFRILRIALPARGGVVFVQDMLFWAVCAVLSFLFLLTSIDGVVRIFLLVGELLGGVLYHCTVGVLVMRVAQAIINAVKAVLRFLYRYLLFPIWRLLSMIVALFLRPIRIFGRFVKKSLQKCQFRLKVGRIVLYNHCKGHLKKKLIRKSRENTAYDAEEK